MAPAAGSLILTPPLLLQVIADLGVVMAGAVGAARKCSRAVVAWRPETMMIVALLNELPGHTEKTSILSPLRGRDGGSCCTLPVQKMSTQWYAGSLLSRAF